MNTVLVPVDFSATSLHAARYAAQLMVGHYGVTLVLYHSYSKPSQAVEVTAELEALKKDLMHDHIVKVEILAHEEDDFVEGLERAARHRRADMIVMGITGKSALSQVFFGSNTLKIAETTKVCPVLIVPENAVFTSIKNVMLTSDFKDTHNTTPSVPIKNILDVFHPNLHVVNVDKEHYISLTDSYEKEKQDMKKLFAGYHPEFYFMRLYDIDEAINLFAQDRHIDMIITIRKDASFMEKFFKTSRTKKLSYQTKLPILVIHE